MNINNLIINNEQWIVKFEKGSKKKLYEVDDLHKTVTFYNISPYSELDVERVEAYKEYIKRRYVAK